MQWVDSYFVYDAELLFFRLTVNVGRSWLIRNCRVLNGSRKNTEATWKWSGLVREGKKETSETTFYQILGNLFYDLVIGLLLLTKNLLPFFRYLDTIENALAVGDAVLIENIEESVDPVLGPLLGRETIKKGRYNSLILPKIIILDFLNALKKWNGKPRYKPRL